MPRTFEREIIMTPTEWVVEAFGGVKATAAALNVTTNRVRMWLRKEIPLKYVTPILDAAKRNGADITLDDLYFGKKYIQTVIEF